MGLTCAVIACVSSKCSEDPKVQAENKAKERQEQIEKYLKPLKRKIDELCEKRDNAQPFILQMVEMFATILAMNIKLNWKKNVQNVED